MTKRKKKIIGNIIFYTLLAVIYIFAIFGIVSKFTNGVIYFGNTRIDTVLTDSMSVINEHHVDFLEGTTQIQAFDMVASDKINEDTELYVKDVVLFKSSRFPTPVVHRIVNIAEEGIRFKIENFEKRSFNDSEYIFIDPFTGLVALDKVDITSLDIEIYAPTLYSIYYVIYAGSNPVASEDIITTTQLIKENVYRIKLHYERNVSTSIPIKILSGNLDNQYIASITYKTARSGTLTFKASEIEDKNLSNYSKLFNSYLTYEIRADKAATSDGVFKKDELISRVHTVVPKLGYVVRVLQSVPMIIILVGLSIIIAVASFFWNKESKKSKEKAATSNSEEVIDNPPDKIIGVEEKEDTHDDENREKKDTET